MFFFLSKFLYFLIQPINWVFGGLIWSFFCKKPKRKRSILLFTIGLFFLFTNHFIFNQVMCWWEPPARHSDNLSVYDIGILAGGYSNFFLAEDNGCYPFSERASRLTQASELFFQGKIKQVLLTGGSGYLFGQEPSEALEAKQYLLKIGIPDSCILIEAQSRTTYENALYTRQFLENNYSKTPAILLITSAFHAPRTRACFQKQGLDFEVFCVDYIGEKTRFVPESLFIPDRLGFYRWERLIKEWVGYVMYWVRGYL